MGFINIFKPLSTILLAAPLINLNNIDNISTEKKLVTLGIKPRAAGSGRKYANHGALLPTPTTMIPVLSSIFFKKSIFDKMFRVEISSDSHRAKTNTEGRKNLQSKLKILFFIYLFKWRVKLWHREETTFELKTTALVAAGAVVVVVASAVVVAAAAVKPIIEKTPDGPMMKEKGVKVERLRVKEWGR